MPKPWYESLTLWSNIVALLFGLAEWVIANQTGLSPLIPGETLVVIVAVANLLLRFRTKQPIGRQNNKPLSANCVPFGPCDRLRQQEIMRDYFDKLPPETREAIAKAEQRRGLQRGET